MRNLFKSCRWLVIIFLISSVNAENIAINQNHQFMQLESSFGGRLGVAAINTGNHNTVFYRSHERFPLCSTSKVMAVAAILGKSQTYTNLLAKNITFTQDQITKSGYAPITSKNLTHVMSVSELCSAAIEYSDNLAMNLLIQEVGGLQSLNDFVHSIGDNSFRLNRFEPELNSAIPNDVRDTTTPKAMASSLNSLVFGNVLDKPQRDQLQNWLKGNTTGNLKIRAGVPSGWIVGDKTGAGDYGTTNDVGVIWIPNCSPIVLAIYFTKNEKNAKSNDAVIAEATRIVIGDFMKNDTCLNNNKDYKNDKKYTNN